MSATVFLAVLSAALLHASWNAVVRLGGDRFQAIILMSSSQGLIGLAMVLAFPMPAAAAWPWLIASGIVHTAYKMFLAAAYTHGDLSRVYPIARGAAPVMVAIFAAIFLSEAVDAMGYAGIALVAIGIMFMARGVFTGGEAVALLPFAIGSAICTAAYSVLDGLGARAAGTAAGFTGWLFLIDAILITGCGLAWRGRRILPRSLRLWRNGAIAGAMSLGAYWIVIWAMTVAPIPLVTALRETSVLFATAIGIFVMGERSSASKVLAAVIILAGVVVTRL